MLTAPSHFLSDDPSLKEFLLNSYCIDLIPSRIAPRVEPMKIQFFIYPEEVINRQLIVGSYKGHVHVLLIYALSHFKLLLNPSR